MREVTKEELIDLYTKGAYRYEEANFVNCIDNKKIMKEHGAFIDKVKNGKVTQKELKKVAHIFDSVDVKVDELRII